MTVSFINPNTEIIAAAIKYVHRYAEFDSESSPMPDHRFRGSDWIDIIVDRIK